MARCDFLPFERIACAVSAQRPHCTVGCIVHQPPLPVYEGVNEGYLLWGYGPPWVPDAHQLATLEDNQWPDEQTLPGFAVRKCVALVFDDTVLDPHRTSYSADT